MNILRRETFTCVLTILTFTSNIRMCVQITSEKTPEILSGDFESFLNSLGSMVFNKYKKATRVGSDRQRDEYSYSTSSALPTQISMRNESTFKTQKAVLRDVLMMKLVSYYENKYKITDQGSTTNVEHENHVNDADADALNEMKRTEQIQSNLKPKGELNDEEVLVI